MRWGHLFLGGVIIGGVLLVGCATRSFGRPPEPKAIQQSAQYQDGTFQNPISTRSGIESLSEATDAIRRYIRNDQTPQVEIPVARVPGTTFDEPPDDDVRLTWVGHSTVLLEFDGFRVLTDPIWSLRCSPFPHVGPRRFHPPGIRFDDLPDIDAVVISHDHYDHLDHDTVAKLRWRGARFYVPLGVGSHLEGWGIHNYREFDWGESVTIRRDGRTLTLTAAPARHFSGRGMFSRNETLWSSWILAGDTHRVFFGGDSGYFPGLRDIGERYGPFDLVMLPIGAYDPSWADVHLTPEEAVRAFLDLGGIAFVPVHYATFSLAAHTWDEPMERLTRAMADAGIDSYHMPYPGQPVLATEPPSRRRWWTGAP